MSLNCPPWLEKILKFTSLKRSEMARNDLKQQQQNLTVLTFNPHLKIYLPPKQATLFRVKLPAPPLKKRGGTNYGEGGIK